MKPYLYSLVCIVTLMGLFASCKNDSVVIVPGNENRVGQIALRIGSAPSGVMEVIAKLSRGGFTERTLSLSVSDSGGAASGTFMDVAAGTWHLKVDAMNDSGNVQYTGETDVEVQPGVTSRVTLRLEPATGVIEIEVTWGNNVLFSDNFDQGNVNGWIYKTGAWYFVDSLVRTDDDAGHHFLMLPNHDFRNFQLQADVMKTSDDTYPEHPGIVFRWTADTMNYMFRINGWGSQSWIQLIRDLDNNDMNGKYIHTEPWLASDTDHQMDHDVWYTMMVKAQDDHIQCKIWKKSDPEPDGWIIDLHDATYSHGLIGLEYYTGRHRFDNVIVTTGN